MPRNVEDGYPGLLQLHHFDPFLCCIRISRVRPVLRYIEHPAEDVEALSARRADTTDDRESLPGSACYLLLDAFLRRCELALKIGGLDMFHCERLRPLSSS